MDRMNMAYTVSEEEYEEELLRLLESAKDYLSSFTSATAIAASLIKADNYEGCVKSVAQMRDTLASTDYRLHDVMNIILHRLKLEEEAKQPQDQPAAIPAPKAKPASPEPQLDLKLTETKDKMQQVRDNIKNLGLQVSEEQLQEIMRKANDKAS